MSSDQSRFVLFGFDEPSMIWYLNSNKDVQIVGSTEEFLREYKKDELICAVVSKEKMDELLAKGFDSKAGGDNKRVAGIYLGKWRKEELWVGVNRKERLGG